MTVSAHAHQGQVHSSLKVDLCRIDTFVPDRQTGCKHPLHCSTAAQHSFPPCKETCADSAVPADEAKPMRPGSPSIPSDELVTDNSTKDSLNAAQTTKLLEAYKVDKKPPVVKDDDEPNDEVKPKVVMETLEFVVTENEPDSKLKTSESEKLKIVDMADNKLTEVAGGEKVVGEVRQCFDTNTWTKDCKELTKANKRSIETETKEGKRSTEADAKPAKEGKRSLLADQKSTVIVLKMVDKLRSLKFDRKTFPTCLAAAVAVVPTDIQKDVAVSGTSKEEVPSVNDKSSVKSSVSQSNAIEVLPCTKVSDKLNDVPVTLNNAATKADVTATSVESLTESDAIKSTRVDLTLREEALQQVEPTLVPNTTSNVEQKKADQKKFEQRSKKEQLAPVNAPNVVDETQIRKEDKRKSAKPTKSKVVTPIEDSVEKQTKVGKKRVSSQSTSVEAPPISLEPPNYTAAGKAAKPVSATNQSVPKLVIPTNKKSHPEPRLVSVNVPDLSTLPGNSTSVAASVEIHRQFPVSVGEAVKKRVEVVLLNVHASKDEPQGEPAVESTKKKRAKKSVSPARSSSSASGPPASKVSKDAAVTSEKQMKIIAYELQQHRAALEQSASSTSKPRHRAGATDQSKATASVATTQTNTQTSNAGLLTVKQPKRRSAVKTDVVTLPEKITPTGPSPPQSAEKAGFAYIEDFSDISDTEGSNPKIEAKKEGSLKQDSSSGGNVVLTGRTAKIKAANALVIAANLLAPIFDKLTPNRPQHYVERISDDTKGRLMKADPAKAIPEVKVFRQTEPITPVASSPVGIPTKTPEEKSPEDQMHCRTLSIVIQKLGQSVTSSAGCVIQKPGQSLTTNAGGCVIKKPRLLLEEVTEPEVGVVIKKPRMKISEPEHHSEPTVIKLAAKSPATKDVEDFVPPPTPLVIDVDKVVKQESRKRKRLSAAAKRQENEIKLDFLKTEMKSDISASHSNVEQVVTEPTTRLRLRKINPVVVPVDDTYELETLSPDLIKFDVPVITVKPDLTVDAAASASMKRKPIYCSDPAEKQSEASSTGQMKCRFVKVGRRWKTVSDQPSGPEMTDESNDCNIDSFPRAPAATAAVLVDSPEVSTSPVKKKKKKSRRRRAKELAASSGMSPADSLCTSSMESTESHHTKLLAPRGGGILPPVVLAPVQVEEPPKPVIVSMADLQAGLQRMGYRTLFLDLDDEASTLYYQPVSLPVCDSLLDPSLQDESEDDCTICPSSTITLRNELDLLMEGLTLNEEVGRVSKSTEVDRSTGMDHSTGQTSRQPGDAKTPAPVSSLPNGNILAFERYSSVSTAVHATKVQQGMATVMSTTHTQDFNDYNGYDVVGTRNGASVGDNTPHGGPVHIDYDTDDQFDRLLCESMVDTVVDGPLDDVTPSNDPEVIDWLSYDSANADYELYPVSDWLVAGDDCCDLNSPLSVVSVSHDSPMYVESYRMGSAAVRTA